MRFLNYMNGVALLGTGSAGGYVFAQLLVNGGTLLVSETLLIVVLELILLIILASTGLAVAILNVVK